MMTTTNIYYFADAQPACNDAQRDTWEVRARLIGSDRWYTVSDSSEMTQAEAVELAQSMREAADES